MARRGEKPCHGQPRVAHPPRAAERRSGAGRTLRGSRGAPGPVPAPSRRGSDSRSPRGLAVLAGAGCPAAPETRILLGALLLTNPTVARPALLYFSIFPSTLPGSCPTLWFQVPSPASDFSSGQDPIPSPLEAAGARALPGAPRGAALLLRRPGSENALFPRRFARGRVLGAAGTIL